MFEIFIESIPEDPLLQVRDEWYNLNYPSVGR